MKSRYKFLENDYPYFVTATTIEWLPIFTHEKYFQIIKASLDFCQKAQKLELTAWVILDNHLHLVISGENLSGAMRDFKSFTAKKIIEQIENDQKHWLLNQLEYYKKRYKIQSQYQIWQEGVHPQMLQNEKMLEQKVAYIHENPVRRGYVDDPIHWVYSSARIILSEAGAS